MVSMPVDIASSKALRSLARTDRPWAVKKLIGLSSAELTRLPVARRVWVCVIRSEVCCNCRRLERTPGERTMSLMADSLPHWAKSLGRDNEILGLTDGESGKLIIRYP